MVDKRKKRAQKDKKRREALRKAKAVKTSAGLTEAQIGAEVKKSHQALMAQDPARAERILMRVQRSNPDHPHVLANLTSALEQLDRIDDAITVAERFSRKHPERPEAFNNLGAAYKFKGRFDEARAAFERSVELSPLNGGSWRNLASVKKFTPEDEPEIERMKQSLTELPLRHKMAVELEFALGKAFEDLGRFDESFQHYKRGNHARRLQTNFRFDRLATSIELLKQHLDQEWVSRGPIEGASDAAPILVVGMPRSGSTLVEQILSSHPDAAGVGEVRDLVDVLTPIVRDTDRYPEILATLPDEVLAGAGASYASMLQKRQPGVTRVVDKFLFNYLHVGFLSRALPNAKIVHCLRDPMDNCFACYKVHFTAPVHFAYDLEDLGKTYQLYRQVMEHWEQVLPGHVTTVKYEELVADQEGQTRRLLEACDLPWDDATLRFHETERRVNSASAAQVRKPIYKTSVAKWKRYEDHLDVLKQALGPYAP